MSFANLLLFLLLISAQQEENQGNRFDISALSVSPVDILRVVSQLLQPMVCLNVMSFDYRIHSQLLLSTENRQTRPVLSRRP